MADELNRDVGSTQQLIVIDTDCGVDDAEALILAVQRPEWKILAITCVAGNAAQEYVCENVLRVLKVCRKEGQYNVHKGSVGPIIESVAKPTGRIHGHDGFGGLSSTIRVDAAQLSTEHAVFALINLVKQYPKQITLITLGPLTNVALANSIWPGFSANLKQIHIMGGNYLGRGNITMAAEFNFAFDPEAAHMVLKDFKCPKRVVTWEAAIMHTLPWAWYHKWTSSNSIKAAFVKKLLKETVERRRDAVQKSEQEKGYHSCDLFAVAIAIRPDSILEEHPLYATVELSGKITRGQMVVDWRGTLPAEEQRKPNVTVVTSVDMDKIQSLYDKMLL